MKLRIMSDLHLEFNLFETVPLDEDLVILTGDIAPMQAHNVPAWARRQWPELDILWVLGNHEHYQTWTSVAEGIKLARAQAAEQEVIVAEPGGAPADEWATKRRVHVLEHDVLYSPWGVRFLGCTLWTDFNLYGDPFPAMQAADRCMADFRGAIEPDDPRESDCFRARDSRELHRKAVNWLDSTLTKPYDGKTVVITHHAPHPATQHRAHVGSALSPSFCSDLGWLIKRHSPDVWISGHSHSSHKLQVGKTLLISNQRGYYAHRTEFPDAPFDPHLVIEI